MKQLVTISTILLLAYVGSASAYRVIEQTEESYELALADVTFPRSAIGSVRFKSCRECSFVSLRTTEKTNYVVNGATLPFTEFFELATDFRENRSVEGSTAVYIFVDIETQQIKRVALDHFG
jgi:hypothetical protein